MFLEGAPIICVSQGQKQVTLSVTESSLYSVVVVAQCMLHAVHFVEALELTAEKPVELQMDNKGCFDLINNWSVAGRTRHVDSRENFMRELFIQNIFPWKIYKTFCQMSILKIGKFLTFIVFFILT